CRQCPPRAAQGVRRARREELVMALEVEVLPDADKVAERGAEYVAEQARAAVADHGRFTFAVSGGRTPWAMFAHLADKMPWEKVTIYQVDERIAPEDDPTRNLTHLRESLPAGGPADVPAKPGHAEDHRGAAAGQARGRREAVRL